MKLYDAGSGLPIVVVPGITGRWEWMTPALIALGRHGRVISYSLCGEPGSARRLPGDAAFEAHIEQLDAVLDAAGVRRALLCGVSFGGWVALRYAARRPSRVLGLVLSSTPGPGFRPDIRQERYVRRPLLLAPIFVATASARLRQEITTAIPRRVARWAFTQQQLGRIARSPMSPRLMARRITGALREDFASDCRHIDVPTLLLTGEAGLDHVVPLESTREYLERIADCRHAVVAGTGHLAVVTRPDTWADVVGSFGRSIQAVTHESRGFQG
jgi:pimeloyl-ACP methyl ester carboxylesterase